LWLFFAFTGAYLDVHLVPLSAAHPEGYPEPVLEALRRICTFRLNEVQKLNPANQRLLASAEALIALRLDLEMQLFGGRPPPVNEADCAPVSRTR
jgi:hypothetical protein